MPVKRVSFLLTAAVVLIVLVWTAGCGSGGASGGPAAQTAAGSQTQATATTPTSVSSLYQVTYTDKQRGLVVTVASLPGQVSVITTSATTPATTIDALALQNGGTPLVGQGTQCYYIFSVAAGTEARFISAMSASSLVLDAFPNLQFQTANAPPAPHHPKLFRSEGLARQSTYALVPRPRSSWRTLGASGVPSVGNGTNLITIDNFKEPEPACPDSTHGQTVQAFASNGLSGHGQALDIASGAFHSVNEVMNQAITTGNAAGGNTIINVSLQAALVVDGKNNPNYQASQEAFIQGLATNLAAQLASGNLDNVSVVLAAGNGQVSLDAILSSLYKQFPQLFNDGHFVVVTGSGKPGACSPGSSKVSNTTSKPFPNVVSAPDEDVPIPVTPSLGVDCSGTVTGTSFAAPAVSNSLITALQHGGGKPLKQIVPQALMNNAVIDPDCSPSPSPAAPCSGPVTGVFTNNTANNGANSFTADSHAYVTSYGTPYTCFVVSSNAYFQFLLPSLHAATYDIATLNSTLGDAYYEGGGPYWKCTAGTLVVDLDGANAICLTLTNGQFQPMFGGATGNFTVPTLSGVLPIASKQP